MGKNRGDVPADVVSKSGRSGWSKSRVIAVGSILGTLISAVAIIVPLVVSSSERTTAEDGIKVESQRSSIDGAGLAAADDDAEGASAIEPVVAGLSSSVAGASSSGYSSTGEWYAIPVDAPWVELFATPGACTTEISDWLNTHGRIMPPWMITASITNTATSGTTATVSRIRAQGTLTEPPVETVLVGAMGCTGAGEEGVYATMRLGVDPVAVFDDCYSPQAEWPCAGSGEAVPIAGDPVSFPVPPGEARTVNLRWTQTTDFVGRFVATLEIDGRSSTIDLSPNGVDLDYPAAPQHDGQLYFGQDGPWCEDGARVRNDSCGLDAWLAVLGE